MWPGGAEDRGADRCGPGRETYWRRVLLSAVAGAAGGYATHEFDLGYSTITGGDSEVSRICSAYVYLRGWIEVGLDQWKVTRASAWTFLTDESESDFTDADFCMSATSTLYELRLKAEGERRASEGISSGNLAAEDVLEAQQAPEPASREPPIALLPSGTALARVPLYPHWIGGGWKEADQEEGPAKVPEETTKAPVVTYRRVPAAEEWAASIPWPPPGWEK